MLRQLRHDVWATEQLIARCRSLTPEQLQLTVPGTDGTILRTLAHLVAADQRYLSRFVTIPDMFREDHDVPLDELGRHMGDVKAGVEQLFAGQDFDPDREF